MALFPLKKDAGVDNWSYIFFSILVISAPTSQNDQTHSNNLSVVAAELF